MLVHYSKDKAYHLKKFEKGLYYLDVSNPEMVTLTTERGDTYCSFLYTVNANMGYFTCADIEGPDRARDLQHLLVWPYNQQPFKYLSNNLIIKCPVLSNDMICAHAIYGPATVILKGEMVRKKPKHVEFKKIIPIQEEILKHHP